MGTGDPSETGVPNVTALIEALLLGIGVVGGSGVPVGVRVSVLVGPNASLGGF